MIQTNDKMINTKVIVIICLCLLGFACEETSTGIIYTNSNYPIEERVEDLLSRMNIEEKVSQMRIFHAMKGIELGENGKMVLTDDVKNRLKYGIAGIKNPGEHIEPIQAATLNNQLQKYIIENNRWGIPALFVTESYNGVDAKGGTKFGRPITMAASWDTTLVNKVWDVIGREARLRGMHMCHSPVADIARDPRFGRMSESSGEDTYLASRMIAAAVKGVQGDFKGLGNGTHIGAVTKHFAGYGQILGGTNFAAVEISERTLIDEIFPPYKAAVQEGRTLGIMASHADLNGIASHGNPALLRGVLRDQWGFEGYTVSDANDIGRLHYFMKVAETPEAAAIMGLTAGMDVDLYADDAYALLPEIAKTNEEILPLIDDAVRHVLRTKFILNLFDDPYINLETVEPNYRTEESLQLAQTADLESMILLKNENNILPLKKGAYKKIALIGPLLQPTAQAAFEGHFGAANVVFEKGFELTNRDNKIPKLNSEENYTNGLNRIMDTVKGADLAVMYLGGDEYTAKEAFFNGALGDRAEINPLGPQDELIAKVKSLGIPVVVILKHRRTLAINTISEQADAILDCWDLSEQGDQSIMKILSGEVSPSGKLPVTIPRSIGQLPYHYSQKGINYKKGYLFIENGPLYPFGYGLSYGEFEYSNLMVSHNELAQDGEITVSVDVTNNGSMLAKEIVQLYVKDEIGCVSRPDRELKGFEKIELEAGETKKVSFTIKPKMLEFTGLEMKKVLEPGAYRVFVGGSSKADLEVKFTLL